MGRTVPSSICVKVQKEDNNLWDDCISQLPDELLIIILGLLSFAEADPELGEFERPSYIGFVNRVLQLHQGSHISEFKVNFPLACNNSCDIDQWITFAISKRVRSLELDLQGSRIGVPPFPHTSPRYSFSEKVYSRIKTPCGLSCINYITQLSLKFINVTGELVEHFLCNCPLLERLCVRGSEQLSKLRVVGPALHLKFLEISACNCLESVDIYAPNLASFICLEMHARTQILVSYAPLLVDLTLGIPTVCYNGPAAKRHFSRLESLCFSQLESLTLCLRLFLDLSLLLVNCTLLHLPELTNLKNLKLEVFASACTCFPDWTCLIKKSPSLHSFTLQLGSHRRKWGKILEPSKCIHKCLEVVEFDWNFDIDLAMYLIQNAIALKKIIVDCRHAFRSKREELYKDDECTEKLTTRALELKRMLPLGVELIIL